MAIVDGSDRALQIDSGDLMDVSGMSLRATDLPTDRQKMAARMFSQLGLVGGCPGNPLMVRSEQRVT